MKPIKITPEVKLSFLDAFQKYMEEQRFTSNRLTFTADLKEALKKDLPRPKVLMTPIAAQKINQLVQDTPTEIAWHGIVSRDNHNFIIEDIILYPHYITGTTATTEFETYTEWLNSIEDTNLYNSIRFQGHSHVNMGTSPSNTDEQYYNDMLQTLADDDYYIFMIINKKQEYHLWIYDLANNTIFETEDIDFGVKISDTQTLKEWADTEKEKYILTRPTTTAYTNDAYERWKQERLRYGYGQIEDESEAYRDPFFSSNVLPAGFEFPNHKPINPKNRGGKNKHGKRK